MTLLNDFSFAYFEITFNGKQPPKRATTQSKCGEFCTNVLNSVAMQSSVSFEYSLPKHNAASPSNERIAVDPNHNVQDDPISAERESFNKFSNDRELPTAFLPCLPCLPRLYLLDNVPRILRLHDEMSGAHAAGPFVTKFSSDS